MSPAVREAWIWAGSLGALGIATALVGRGSWVLLSLVLWAGAGGVAFFFRDPPRRPQCVGSLSILAPADGTVVEVGPAQAPFDLGSRRRIAIFLSLWDVHVNRSPVEGRVVRQERHPGRFWDARSARAATENERVDWLLETVRGPVALRQIAGKVARRIETWVGPGQNVSLGQKIGMIRLGSRVELYLPWECQCRIRVGDHVRAGETCLGSWP